jgi:hypothetical protein
MVKGEVLADFKKLPIKGIPATSGHAWDVVRNGPLNAQASTVIDGVDYRDEGPLDPRLAREWWHHV